MAQADDVLSTSRPNTSASDDDLHTPESLQDVLYRRTDISPETFFQALGRVRRAARDEIEQLIAWLDSTIDVDEDSAADDEPCDDRELEPSLGSFDRMSDQIKAWLGGACDVDAELDKCDDEESDAPEDGADSEPSLGTIEVQLDLGTGYACTQFIDQSRKQGNRDDCEGDEHDGREPGEDDEPSLCGITADCKWCDDRDLERDLGSFDRMMDQSRSTGVRGNWTGIEGGEVDSTL